MRSPGTGLRDGANAAGRAGSSSRAADGRDAIPNLFPVATAQRGDVARAALRDSPYAPLGFASPHVQEPAAPRWSAFDEALAEFVLRSGELSGGDLFARWARAVGIDLEPMRHLELLGALLPMRLDDDGRADFAELSDPARRPCVVLEEPGTDLVVFDVCRPKYVATVLGAADLLGAAALANPASYFGGRAVRVWRSPIAWLRAGCIGAAIVEPTRLWDVLADAPAVLAEDREHAFEIARATRGFFDPRRIRSPSHGR